MKDSRKIDAVQVWGLLAALVFGILSAVLCYRIGLARDQSIYESPEQNIGIWFTLASSAALPLIMAGLRRFRLYGLMTASVLLHTLFAAAICLSMIFFFWANPF